MTPLRDLCKTLAHKSKTISGYACTRADRKYAQGYERAMKDFIIGIKKVQDTYTWKYQIKEGKMMVNCNCDQPNHDPRCKNYQPQQKLPFDPHNINHIRGYQQLSETGTWPQEHDIIERTTTPLWVVAIQSKLAQAWVDSKLK